MILVLHAHHINAAAIFPSLLPTAGPIIGSSMEQERPLPRVTRPFYKKKPVLGLDDSSRPLTVAIVLQVTLFNRHTNGALLRVNLWERWLSSCLLS